MMPRLIVSKVAIASTAPAAPSRWPIIDFVLLIATLRACSPRAIFNAFVSPASLSCVDVRRLQPRVLESQRDRLRGRLARLVGCDLVEGIVGGRVSEDLAVDASAATDRVLA